MMCNQLWLLADEKFIKKISTCEVAAILS